MISVIICQTMVVIYMVIKTPLNRPDASGEAKILEKIVSTASSLGKTVLIINFPFPIVSDSFFGFHYSLAFSNVNIKRGNFLISILHRCKLKII